MNMTILAKEKQSFIPKRHLQKCYLARSQYKGEVVETLGSFREGIANVHGKEGNFSAQPALPHQEVSRSANYPRQL